VAKAVLIGAVPPVMVKSASNPDGLPTDFTEDLKKMDMPALILHGDADQIVPINISGMKPAKLVKNATLKVYPGAPHGMCTTLPDKVNADLLEFLQS
jgi:non-heme chloroperoxidase